MKNKLIILLLLVFTTFSLNAQTKYVLLEELTGTWCQYCPRGTYYLDSLCKVYPNFIGVAIHTSDDMENIAYSSASGLTAAPSAKINRLVSDLPTGSWFPSVASAFNTIPSAEITLYTNFENSTRLLTVRVKATFTTAVSGNYRLGAIITEDGITGPSPQYNQSNIYSGGGNGIVGGFESLPSPIPASMLAYNHVGRELLGGYNGQTGSVPSSIAAGDTASYTFTYTIPSTWNEEYIKVIGLLFKPDNSIDNAGKSNYLDGNSNAKPLFISQPITTANIGSPYLFDIFVTDPDDENLTITSINIPTWLTISPSSQLGMIHTKATLSGTPTTSGSYPIEIMLSDGSRSDTLSYTLNVNASYSGNWVLEGEQGFANIDNNLGIVVDNNGVIYAFIEYNDVCNVYRKTNSQNWTNYGNLNGSGSVGHIRIGSDGVTPYVAYSNAPSQVTVKKYVNGAWTSIGNFPTSGVVQFGFDLDASDHPYIACQDVNDGSKGSCYKYDGTAWIKLGNTNYSGNVVAVANDVVVNKSNGNVYVLWSNYNNGKVPTVTHWNGSTWSMVGGGSVANSQVHYYENIVINKNTQQLYISFARYAGGSIYLDAYKYNGTSWENIGTDIANGEVDEPKMTITNAGTPIISYIDYTHSNSVSAISYVNGNWNNIGPLGFTNGLSEQCRITTFNNMPYVLYRDGAALNKSTVRYYNYPVSIDEIDNSSNSMSIYPNPAKNQITITIDEQLDEERILNIYNIFGSLVKTETLHQNHQNINVGDLSNGLYLVIIKSKQSTQNQKLIIQR